jgi:hypothetical protein
MHNRVRKKQDVFKQPCQSLSTNSELLPASAYNCAIRCSVRSLTLTRSASIIFRLKARDCFFLGWVGRAWGKYFGHVREIHIYYIMHWFRVLFLSVVELRIPIMFLEIKKKAHRHIDRNT